MDGKSILITGGTGTFGQAFIKYVLENYKPRRLIVFSRDEFKQFEMRKRFDGDPMRYFIGDVRDKSRLRMAFRPVDIVVHAAALKQVPSGEINPIEVKKTNIDGAQNVIVAAIECGVEKVLALSTDKAVNPVNLYGSTKLCAEKLFLNGNMLSGEGGTRFSVMRYGNVANSRGSVIPFFRECAQNGEIPLTDTRMTRFFIKIEDAVAFAAARLEKMQGDEIFIPKMRAMRIKDLAHAIGGNKCTYPVIGVRPGEKIHETLISAEETGAVINKGPYYAVHPSEQKIAGMIPNKFNYWSDNGLLMTIHEIQEFLDGL